MLTNRLATEADLPALTELMAMAIEQLQREFLSEEELAASRHLMGLDTQLIADRTYFIVEQDGCPVGCGGWSRRATLYGGDHSQELRDPAFLDPTRDGARVRAMYSHPHFVRRGIGRLILGLCEEAAAVEGFRSLELMATLAGEQLYRACGFLEVERVYTRAKTGVAVPFVRMSKAITSPG